MATTNQRRETKEKGILREVCTQADWSLRLSRPGFGALVLLFMVIVNETWVNFNIICETIPFFFKPVPKDNSKNYESDGKNHRPNPAQFTPSEWKRSQEACLKAICRVADKVEFDCQVDETGDSAHMMVIDDPVSYPITFDSQIPFPVDCHHTLELMLGSETLESLGDYLRSYMFQTEAIDLIHLYESHLQPTTSIADDETTSSEGDDGTKNNKKALIQIIPGQCAVWEILQQSWYEWHGDFEGDPPPPIPLVDFDGKEPGEVVRIRAREYLCYEEYIPKEHFKSWMDAYELVLEYRWYPSFVAAFYASAIMELMGMMAVLMRFLPLTICFWKYAKMDPVDPGDYKMLRAVMGISRISMHLVGIHAMAAAIVGSEQVYSACFLATSSMLMYGNTKASIEWIFLHILSYGVDYFDIDAALNNGQPVYNLALQSVDELMDIFVPAPGLCYKAIVVYMIYMSSSRLLNTL